MGAKKLLAFCQVDRVVCAALSFARVTVNREPDAVDPTISYIIRFTCACKPSLGHGGFRGCDPYMTKFSGV
jgi:hypothetical protein